MSPVELGATVRPVVQVLVPKYPCTFNVNFTFLARERVEQENNTGIEQVQLVVDQVPSPQAGSFVAC